MNIRPAITLITAILLLSQAHAATPSDSIAAPDRFGLRRMDLTFGLGQASYSKLPYIDGITPYRSNRSVMAAISYTYFFSRHWGIHADMRWWGYSAAPLPEVPGYSLASHENEPLYLLSSFTIGATYRLPLRRWSFEGMLSGGASPLGHLFPHYDDFDYFYTSLEDGSIYAVRYEDIKATHKYIIRPTIRVKFFPANERTIYIHGEVSLSIPFDRITMGTSVTETDDPTPSYGDFIPDRTFTYPRLPVVWGITLGFGIEFKYFKQK